VAHYVLEYALVRDYLEQRTALREEHLELARAAAARGDLMLAGALADPTDRAVFVCSVDDAALVASFAEQDPYVRHGLVTSWTVRPWTAVVGWALEAG
jgi:uncharacterized protein